MRRQAILLLAAICVLLIGSTPTLWGQAPVQCDAVQVVDDGGERLELDDVVARPQPDATCTAVCNSGITVSCTGSSCSAVNASCPSQQGYVTCGTRTVYCPSCPPPPGCPGGVPACSSLSQCEDLCGGPGYGTCNNGCCYCY
jgi:hypothetical protein